MTLTFAFTVTSLYSFLRAPPTLNSHPSALKMSPLTAFLFRERRTRVRIQGPLFQCGCASLHRLSRD
jgi:hypothetical protein